MAYINDMPVNPGARINLFANDTMIHTTSISIRYAATKLQKQINLLILWLENWKCKQNGVNEIWKTSKNLLRIIRNQRKSHPMESQNQISRSTLRQQIILQQLHSHNYSKILKNQSNIKSPT